MTNGDHLAEAYLANARAAAGRRRAPSKLRDRAVHGSDACVGGILRKASLERVERSVAAR